MTRIRTPQQVGGGLLQDGCPRIGYIQEPKPHQAGIRFYGRFGEHEFNEGPVTPGRHIFNPLAGEDPAGMLRNGLHEGISLVGAAPRKALLG